MGKNPKGLNQHGAAWGSTLKGWGSMGKHSNELGLGQHGVALQRPILAWDSTLKDWSSLGKHSVAPKKHGAAWGNTLENGEAL